MPIFLLNLPMYFTLFYVKESFLKSSHVLRWTSGKYPNPSWSASLLCVSQKSINATDPLHASCSRSPVVRGTSFSRPQRSSLKWRECGPWPKLDPVCPCVPWCSGPWEWKHSFLIPSVYVHQNSWLLWMVIPSNIYIYKSYNHTISIYIIYIYK